MNMKAPHSAGRPYAQGARARSTEENGRRIVDAFINRLMKQWYDEITLDLVAEDSGVTVQTIVRRFGGKEGLLGQAVVILAAKINAQRAMPGGDIDGIVESLFADYEQTGDTVMRLLALEPRHPAIRIATDVGRREHRQWVTGVFGSRLGGLGATARQRAIDALIIATDVYAWKLLRRDMGRAVPVAMATMKFLIQAAIGEVSNAK
jgi:AcrR family transcriptional regulator